MWDEQGEPLVTNHASKKGKRYRYYVSKPQESGAAARWRLPANQIEAIVRAATIDLLEDQTALVRDLQSQGIASAMTPALLKHAKQAVNQLKADGQRLASLLQRVDLKSSELRLSVRLASEDERPVMIERSVPMSMRRRGVETRLILESGSAPQIDTTLIRAVARARAGSPKYLRGKFNRTEKSPRARASPMTMSIN